MSGGYDDKGLGEIREAEWSDKVDMIRKYLTFKMNSVQIPGHSSRDQIVSCSCQVFGLYTVVK